MIAMITWNRARRFDAAFVLTTLVAGVGLVQPAAAQAVADAPAAEAPARGFTIADGGFSLEAPQGWQRVQPKFGMIETEFSIPAEGGETAGTPAQPGRMTVMGAGGSIQDNIDRWYGQFSQLDGSATKDKATTKKLNLAGCRVTLVDIPGTFKDAPGGPFAGGATVERPGYRMLAAVVETPDRGNYFLKFYGPAATVEKHAAGFRTMVEGMVATGK